MTVIFAIIYTQLVKTNRIGREKEGKLRRRRHQNHRGDRDVTSQANRPDFDRLAC